jgi:hypothetical protein
MRCTARAVGASGAGCHRPQPMGPSDVFVVEVLHLRDFGSDLIVQVAHGAANGLNRGQDGHRNAEAMISADSELFLLVTGVTLTIVGVLLLLAALI